MACCYMSNAGGLRLEIIFLRAFEPAGLTNLENTGSEEIGF